MDLYPALKQLTEPLLPLLAVAGQLSVQQKLVAQLKSLSKPIAAITCPDIREAFDLLDKAKADNSAKESFGVINVKIVERYQREKPACCVLLINRATFESLSGAAGITPMLQQVKSRCQEIGCRLVILYVYHKATSDMPEEMSTCIRKDVGVDARFLIPLQATADAQGTTFRTSDLDRVFKCITGAVVEYYNARHAHVYRKHVDKYGAGSEAGYLGVRIGFKLGFLQEIKGDMIASLRHYQSAYQCMPDMLGPIQTEQDGTNATTLIEALFVGEWIFVKLLNLLLVHQKVADAVQLARQQVTMFQAHFKGNSPDALLAVYSDWLARQLHILSILLHTFLAAHPVLAPDLLTNHPGFRQGPLLLRAAGAARKRRQLQQSLAQQDLREQTFISEHVTPGAYVGQFYINTETGQRQASSDHLIAVCAVQQARSAASQYALLLLGQALDSYRTLSGVWHTHRVVDLTAAEYQAAGQYEAAYQYLLQMLRVYRRGQWLLLQQRALLSLSDCATNTNRHKECTTYQLEICTLAIPSNIQQRQARAIRTMLGLLAQKSHRNTSTISSNATSKGSSTEQTSGPTSDQQASSQEAGDNAQQNTEEAAVDSQQQIDNSGTNASLYQYIVDGKDINEHATKRRYQQDFGWSQILICSCGIGCMSSSDPAHEVRVRTQQSHRLLATSAELPQKVSFGLSLQNKLPVDIPISSVQIVYTVSDRQSEGEREEVVSLQPIQVLQNSQYSSESANAANAEGRQSNLEVSVDTVMGSDNMEQSSAGVGSINSLHHPGSPLGRGIPGSLSDNQSSSATQELHSSSLKVQCGRASLGALLKRVAQLNEAQDLWAAPTLGTPRSPTLISSPTQYLDQQVVNSPVTPQASSSSTVTVQQHSEVSGQDDKRKPQSKAEAASTKGNLNPKVSQLVSDYHQYLQSQWCVDGQHVVRSGQSVSYEANITPSSFGQIKLVQVKVTIAQQACVSWCIPTFEEGATKFGAQSMDLMSDRLIAYTGWPPLYKHRRMLNLQKENALPIDGVQAVTYANTHASGVPVIGRSVLEMRYEQPAPDFMLVAEGFNLAGEQGTVMFTVMPRSHIQEMTITLQVLGMNPDHGVCGYRCCGMIPGLEVGLNDDAVTRSGFRARSTDTSETSGREGEQNVGLDGIVLKKTLQYSMSNINPREVQGDVAQFMVSGYRQAVIVGVLKTKYGNVVRKEVEIVIKQPFTLQCSTSCMPRTYIVASPVNTTRQYKKETAEKEGAGVSDTGTSSESNPDYSHTVSGSDGTVIAPIPVVMDEPCSLNVTLTVQSPCDIIVDEVKVIPQNNNIKCTSAHEALSTTTDAVDQLQVKIDSQSVGTEQSVGPAAAGRGMRQGDIYTAAFTLHLKSDETCSEEGESGALVSGKPNNTSQQKIKESLGTVKVKWRRAGQPQVFSDVARYIDQSINGGTPTLTILHNPTYSGTESILAAASQAQTPQSNSPRVSWFKSSAAQPAASDRLNQLAANIEKALETKASIQRLKGLQQSLLNVQIQAVEYNINGPTLVMQNAILRALVNIPGVLRQAETSEYSCTLQNITQEVLEAKVSLVDAVGFLIAGYKVVEIKLEPYSHVDMAWLLLPHATGYLKLPQLKVQLQRYGYEMLVTGRDVCVLASNQESGQVVSGTKDDLVKGISA